MNPAPANRRPGAGRSEPRNFWIVLLATVTLAFAASQFTARWLGFRSASMLPYDYGSPASGTRAFVASSSLGYYGLDWGDIATNTGWYIRRYDIPAASPCEFEQTQDLVPNATRSVLVVSIFDLDETYFSGFRPAIVPAGRTIRDLVASGTSWAFDKRTLSLYAEHWLQALFPTAGSAMGVCVGWRDKLRSLRRSPGGGVNAERAVLNGQNSNFPTTRVSEWDRGRLLRNAAESISAAQRVHFFNGPKHAALTRVLEQALQRGSTFVVVMPVTPEYRQIVLSPAVLKRFEASLADLRQRYPAARFIRLDRLPVLDDSKYFWDLLHLNAYGRPIATRALEDALRQTSAGK